MPGCACVEARGCLRVSFFSTFCFSLETVSHWTQSSSCGRMVCQGAPRILLAQGSPAPSTALYAAGIQVQVLILAQQTLYPWSHFLSPTSCLISLLGWVTELRLLSSWSRAFTLYPQNSINRLSIPFIFLKQVKKQSSLAISCWICIVLWLASFI